MALAPWEALFPVGCVLKLDHIVLTYTVYISSCVVLVKRICLMVSVPAFFQTLKAVLFALRGIPGAGKVWTGIIQYHNYRGRSFLDEGGLLFWASVGWICDVKARSSVSKVYLTGKGYKYGHVLIHSPLNPYH